jgi:Peptidase family S58
MSPDGRSCSAACAAVVFTLLLIVSSSSAQTPPPTPGPLNAITDVPGIKVGHHTLGDQNTGTPITGTTVVVYGPGATGGVSQRGGAPGTRETDLLRPENLVEKVNAVTLSGGSAYGLAAADGTATRGNRAATPPRAGLDARATRPPRGAQAGVHLTVREGVRANPSVRIVKKLARALGVPVTALLK